MKQRPEITTQATHVLRGNGEHRVGGNRRIDGAATAFEGA